MKISVIEPRAELLTSEDYIQGIGKHIEVCGRTCKKSEDKITDDSWKLFVRTLARMQHLSVFEHALITFRFVCSRACSHQLVRHRIGSYSQESMRYCDYSGGLLRVIAPRFLKLPCLEYEVFQENDIFVDSERFAASADQAIWLNSVHFSFLNYARLVHKGVRAEDARSLLPEATKTEVVASFNLRQWIHVFNERALNKAAQDEVRLLCLSAYNTLNAMIPEFFADTVNK